MWLVHLLIVAIITTHIVGVIWIRRLAALENPPFHHQVMAWSTALAPIGLLAPLLGLGTFVAWGAMEASIIFGIPLVLGLGFLVKSKFPHTLPFADRVEWDTGIALVLGSIFPWSTVICFLPW